MTEVVLKKNDQVKLPKGWIWTTVSEIGLIISGQTPRGIDTFQKNDKIPFFKISDMNKSENELFMNRSEINLNESDVHNLHLNIQNTGTVIFPKRGGAIATNKKRILSKPSCYDLNIMGIFPIGISPKFIYYWISRIDLVELSDGSNVPQINHTDISPLQIPLPPLNEQKRIILKIEELFSRIDFVRQILKKIKTLLKQNRQSLLKSAFEGNLTTREQNDEPASTLLEKIKQTKSSESKKGTKSLSEMIFKKNEDLSKEWKKNNLPHSWQITTIKEISDKIHYGYTATATKNIGTKYLRITDIQNNNVDWSDVPYCKIKDNEIQKYLLHENDLVFARTGGTVGKSFLIKPNPPKSVFASYLIRIVLSDKIIPKFIHYFFNSSDYWNQISLNKTGLKTNVNAQILSHIEIPLAPLNEQKRIVIKIEEGLSLIEDNEKIIDFLLKNLDSLQTSILKQAFEGKLVPQDPNDEPVRILLENIKQEKEKLLEIQKINKTKSFRSRRVKNVK